jgi:hypothetical protein
MINKIGGPLCKHCGWQELPHGMEKITGSNVLRKGYKHTLSNCPGFKPAHKKLFHKLVSFLEQRV